MPSKSITLTAVLFFCLFFSYNIGFAVNVPTSQLMSSQERARQMQEQSKELVNKAQKPKMVLPSPGKPPAEITEAPNAPKVLVRKIQVDGVTVFPYAKIQAITDPYENKNMSVGEMKKVANLITDIYRKKGYITSRAYVPVQKFEKNVLVIRVIEAKIGNIEIRGNRYSSGGLIKKYVTIRKGEIFNYNDLKEDLMWLNGNPDRSVKAVLAAGENQGETDIILNVQESIPVHIGLGYDDYLSYFLRRAEMTTTFTDNNLSGRDDILTVQYNRGNGNDFYYYSGHYVLPVTRLLDLGFLYSRSQEYLGRGLAAAGSSGESKTFSYYLDQKLFKNDDISLDAILGFDYKDVDNYLQGQLSSRDYLRIPKAQLNFDAADEVGRTIITNETDFGAPGILGGTKQDLSQTSVPTSRAGSDGKFALDTLNLVRYQRLPLDASLLWKSQFQFTRDVLTATEQFQAGGPSNNRGFSVADTVGDRGYATSAEFAVPPYFVPRRYVIPFFHARIYDVFRIIGFYDWTNVHLNALQPGQAKNSTLSSAGCGMRVTLADNFYLSYEIGWPISGNPTDGKHVHQWISFTVTF